jgi:bifunctional DNA-binding transcriptional regulator/antitoxin component of YhaV-PrlF toxin-antitoxin module
MGASIRAKRYILYPASTNRQAIRLGTGYCRQGIVQLASGSANGYSGKESKICKVNMSDATIRTITVSSKGQVTLSSSARKQLGIEQGTSLIEVVVGNCLVLLPENRISAQLREEAQAALASAGVTVDDLKEETEKVKQERLAKRYPGLGE